MSDGRKISIQLNRILHEILLEKGFESGRTIEDLAEEALRISFQEDIEDLEAFESRKDEETIPFDEVSENLKQRGLI